MPVHNFHWWIGDVGGFNIWCIVVDGGGGMMEHRYRAWDRVQKKMSYYVNVYSEGDEWWWAADHVNPDTDNTISSFDENTGELMQYAGIKDWMDKRRIYEDDIVFIRGDVMLKRGIIVFKAGGFIISHQEIYNRDFFTDISIFQLEVEGNHYEEPELMP